MLQREACPEAVLSLSGLDGLLGRIYAARGIRSPEELDLAPGGLISPEHMDGVAVAVDLLRQCLLANNRILVVGDYDADGATGTALAVRGLRALGFGQVDYLAPDRFRFGYGLSQGIVELALTRSPDMILTVDNGVSSIEGVAAAKAAGVIVVITDHHLPGDRLPDADAIINPNLDDATFPSKALAGVGVVFYLLLALRARLRESGWFDSTARPEPNLGLLCDLVALGTVADVVPLDRNNRILVGQGLQRIRSGRGVAGIRALLAAAGRDTAKATAADLGFAAAPRLNAAGRLDDMTLGIECLLTDDPFEAKRLAERLDAFNRERRVIEVEMRREAEDVLDGLLRGNDEDWPFGVCLFGDAWHQGVVGIVASRVKDRIHRPVIAFAPAGDGTLKGSGRSIEGLHLRDTLDAIAARHPGLIVRFGGHAMAAGVTLNDGDFNRFHGAFDQAVREQLGEQGIEPSLHTDGELEPGRFNLETAAMLREAGPWGQHFPEPTFDGSFRVLNWRIVGENHLKMQLRPLTSGPDVDAIAFYMAEWADRPADEIRAVYRLEVNEFRGERNLQLQILHLE
ncbi:MAG: single-stranded-DNA-specific exonuclease RecJ [Gammaproteobacteria bacterium]|nr:single-stranded-DNA-specific exonuclease RecJ [Gammaproteobacteria bacterium]MBU1655132.1 single-stranded-DNA-specific exonuclease RecJ [Gammaproteobacteria bacterium]MBU1962098.1 single-stranded-DNA-specific exonuclease RecJ [Gammaproteobacteria bacterium]